MENEYITINGEAEDRFIEKKSEFIGSIAHVETEQEAVAFIDKIKSTYRNAKHYVYVYILRKNSVTRYTDDGEPQGRAAMPAYEALKANNLTDVCFVSTRYFGGILLGGGGLARAYSHSAALACEKAEKVRMILCENAVLDCDYSLYEKLSYCFPQFTMNVKNTEYSDKVKIYFDISANEYEKFELQMTEKSNGKAKIIVEGESYSPIKI